MDGLIRQVCYYPFWGKENGRIKSNVVEVEIVH
jgi:hypothetical protein